MLGYLILCQNLSVPVDMTKPLLSTRSFAWRGQEGSVTDRDAGLVYMQARHYDPSIGRFIQADRLAAS